MKRALLLCGCLLLAGCNWGADQASDGTADDGQFPYQAAYTLTMDNAARRDELVEAAARVISRRLEHLQVYHQPPVIEGDIVRVRIKTATGGDALAAQLQESFSMRFMKEVSLIVAEQQGFIDTGLTHEHVDWLTEVATATGSTVTIGLTPAGQRLKAKIFGENLGKNIGLFIRDHPVYKLTVNEADLATPNIVIVIPDPFLSGVFIDDVNVSNHVTFTPVTP